jgi:hypothetical protein
VPTRRVQAAIRQFFRHWGRPRRFRVDNGSPWGTWNDLPPALALWLIGLGVEMIWNPPRQPQKNGVVERSQGTAKRWAEPGQCRSAAQLQQQLDRVDRLQRERFPACGKQSRLEAYPALRRCARPYCRDWERRHWRLQRVLDHLAEYAVVRRVDCSGKVHVYDHNHYVGALHHGKHVFVSYDPRERHWIISDADGHQLRTSPAREINRAQIVNLKVMNSRPPHRRGTKHKAQAAKLGGGINGRT